MFRAPIRSLGDVYALSLDDDERRVLRRLCVDLRELLEDEDPAVGRLFPAAYRDDAEAAAEFDRLVRDGRSVRPAGGARHGRGRTADAERLSDAEGSTDVVWRPQRHAPRCSGEKLGVDPSELYERAIDPVVLDPRAAEATRCYGRGYTIALCRARSSSCMLGPCCDAPRPSAA